MKSGTSTVVVFNPHRHTHPQDAVGVPDQSGGGVQEPSLSGGDAA